MGDLLPLAPVVQILLVVKRAEAIYRRFVECEELAARIYLRFANRFAGNPALSEFWFDMAMEEKQHAGLLQFCIEEGAFSITLPTAAEASQLQKSLQKLEQRASEPQISVDGAFSIALELESSQINWIYARLTTSLHRSTYLLKRKIATFVPNHLQGLTTAARKFGASANVLKEAANLQKQCA